MSKIITLKIKNRAGKEEKKQLTINKVVCAGYTGKDQHSVMKHIEELKKLGIPGPAKIPTHYLVPSYLLFTDEELEEFEVKGEETSGEVEYVAIIQKSGEIIVTVGSDHTDRWLEKTSIERAKMACPKIISSESWLYKDLKDHFDDLILRMSIKREIEGEWQLYQEGRVGEILPLEHLIKEFDLSKEDNVALFSGTLPIIGGKVVYAKAYLAELIDPVLERQITLTYRVYPIWP